MVHQRGTVSAGESVADQHDRANTERSTRAPFAAGIDAVSIVTERP